MAQPGSASGLGPEGRRFESSRSDQFPLTNEADMDVRIFKPGKSAMTSGRGNSKAWALEFLSDGKRSRDPLMGWTSIDDTAGQIRLTFETREKAIAYARRKGLSFIVEEARERKRLVKSYSENFSATRKQPWTH